MYTEYNSQNINQEFNQYKNEDYQNSSKPNRFFSTIWKMLLVIIVLIVLFLALLKFGVISLASSVSPDAVILNQNEIGLKKGNGYQLIATVLPENAENRQVIWSSSDSTIVSVNELTGYITGLKAGTAVITVKTVIGDKTNECIVNVSDGNVFLTGLHLNEKQISLAVGYTHSISYRTTPTNATELNLKFTSSDTSVATVSKNGTITGVKEGSAIITVSSSNSNIKDNIYVTVYKKGASTVVNGESVTTNNYPKSINILSDNINLSTGSTNQLIATVTPDSANNKISWSSSNSNVATVDANGLVTAKGEGTTTIIAKTINNLIATCKVTVGNYSLKLKNIEITTEYAVLPIGNTKQLAVVFTPSNASNKGVTWSSNNPSVASISENGVVKAISQGSAIITARSIDGGYTDTITVEVVDYGQLIEEKTISFSASTYSVGINQTITLNPIITPSNATFKSVTFQSSDSKIATVDENGVVKGIKEGEVTITATTKRNNIKASVVVNVSKVATTGISLNNTNVYIQKNDTYTLVATILPSNATNQNIKFTSSNPNIATVDSNGIIKAVGVGTTIITVTTSDSNISSTCLVTVTS